MRNPLNRDSTESAPPAPPPDGGGPATNVYPSEPGQEPPEVGIFEPPRSFFAEAVVAHKLLVLALAVLGALIGVGLGLIREPVYTSSATLQVGEVNPNSPGFGSYTQSAGSLATGFSRAVIAGPVLAEVKHRLGIAPRVAASNLSAEPIPLSPVFRVIATGSTETGSIRLANATASAVAKYVSTTNSAVPQSQSLLSAYRKAAFKARRAAAHQKAIEANGSASPAELLGAEAASSTAQVQLEAIARSYVAAVTSQAPRQGLVSILAGASTASSDRVAKLELYAFLGLLAGLLAGLAAATWREVH